MRIKKRVQNLFYKIRVRDFLLGVRVDEIEQDKDTIEQFQDLTDAERLRLVYEILTQPEEQGGAGISTHVDKYVEFIMPLQNDEFNHVSLLVASIYLFNH